MAAESPETRDTRSHLIRWAAVPAQDIKGSRSRPSLPERGAGAKSRIASSASRAASHCACGSLCSPGALGGRAAGERPAQLVWGCAAWVLTFAPHACARIRALGMGSYKRCFP